MESAALLNSQGCCARPVNSAPLLIKSLNLNKAFAESPGCCSEAAGGIRGFKFGLPWRARGALRLICKMKFATGRLPRAEALLSSLGRLKKKEK